MTPRLAEEVLREAARSAAALVGDGCLIRVADGSGALGARAADHRDADRREALLALLEAPPLASPTGWLAQTLERGGPRRLPSLSPDALAAVGLPVDDRVGDAIVYPVSPTGAVIFLVRDRIGGPYSCDERERVERIAAELRADLGVAGDAERPPTRRPPRTTETQRAAGVQPAGCFDPLAHGLLGVTSAALWAVDDDGRTLYVNEPASELVGWTSRELVGTPISEFLGRGVLARSRRFEGTSVCDRRLVRGDGSSSWLEVCSRPLIDDRGLPAGVVHTLVDVDGRRGREIELRLELDRERALRALAEEAIDADLKRLLELSAEMLAERLGVELVSIAGFANGEASEAENLASVGWSARLARVGKTLPRARRLVPRAAVCETLASGDPVIVSDYLGQSAYEADPLLHAAGVRSATVVGFADGRAAVGVHSPTPDAFGGSDVDFIRRVTGLLENRWRGA